MAIIIAKTIGTIILLAIYSIDKKANTPNKSREAFR